MTGALAAREDIEFQRRRDCRRAFDRPALDKRIQNVYSARDAMAKGEQGAAWALRQALVELSSVCEVMVAQMPKPTVDLR